MAMMGIILLLMVILGVAAVLYIIFTLIKIRLALGLGVIANAFRIKFKKKNKRPGEITCIVIIVLCMVFIASQIASVVLPAFKIASISGNDVESLHKKIYVCAEDQRFEDMCERFAENADVSRDEIDDLLDYIDDIDMSDAEFVIEEQLEIHGHYNNRLFVDNDAYRYRIGNIYPEDGTPVYIDIFCIDGDERDSDNDGLWLVAVVDVNGNIIVEAGEELPYSIERRRTIDWDADDKDPLQALIEYIKTGNMPFNDNDWESYTSR